MPRSQCNKCKPVINALRTDNFSHKQKIILLQEENHVLRKKLLFYEELDDTYHNIYSSSLLPDDLRVSNFKEYISGLLENIPILGYILHLFLSISHKKKARAKATPPHWKLWSYFFQAYILEVFLRARSPKTVHRTTLLLSAYMLLGNVSENCWKLLQRLKILVGKKYLEDWIIKQVKYLRSRCTMLVYVFDNCDILLHVTNVRREHRSKMLHLLTRYTFIRNLF